MKRRNFSNGMLLSVLGLAVAPSWTLAFNSGRKAHSIVRLPDPKEHVRHGELDLFGTTDTDLSEFGIRALNRHVFYRNGYSPRPDDVQIIHMVYGSEADPVRLTLLLDKEISVISSRSSGTVNGKSSLYADDQLSINVRSGKVEVLEGDLLICARKRAEVSGVALGITDLLVVRRNDLLEVNNSELLLIRANY